MPVSLAATTLMIISLIALNTLHGAVSGHLHVTNQVKRVAQLLQPNRIATITAMSVYGRVRAVLLTNSRSHLTQPVVSAASARPS